MKLDGFELRYYALPYRRQVRWFRSTEDQGEFVALRVFAEGATGVAEAPVKPTWGGLSPRALAAIVSDIYIPALKDVDPTEQKAVQATLAIFPGNPLAKMLVENACMTLAANLLDLPLWQYLGGRERVEVSWCITRQPPQDMASEAASVVAAHGFRMLKVKGGQGLEVDRAALRAIRATTAPDISLTVDANAAYGCDKVRDYLAMLHDEGVAVAEDPCKLAPDARLASLVDETELPLLVDMPCTSLEKATALLDAGARAISVKPGRVGIPEAQAMACRAANYGAAVCSGMYAESALGTFISLAFSSSLSDPFLPAEQTFFMTMSEQILDIPLPITDGCISLGGFINMDEHLNWERTEAV